MKRDHPDAGKALQNGRKKRSHGLADWCCKICTNPSWSNRSKANAKYHCRTKH
ncbi:hypothetical protein K402DRAFT_393304, partial [Aulographum hederae CBS 113979]